ncbi:hypothetical protein D910_12158, partial [Dendroctonus ponderosae]
AVGLVEVKKLL